MYCKNCGKEIEDNSSFCNHCGKPLDGNQMALVNKPAWIIYLIWTVVNMYLLMGEKSEEYANFFFPFTSAYSIYNGYQFQYNWDKYFYDFSEFIVYVFVIPAILYVVYRRYNKQIDRFIAKVLNKK